MCVYADNKVATTIAGILASLFLVVSAIAAAVEPASKCQSELRKLGVTFATVTARGVDDAVMVTPPVNGLLIQHWPHKDGLQPLLMDCRLAEAIYRMAPALTKLGISSLLGARSYKYRCLDRSVKPPDCIGSKLSLHARAVALDIGGVISSTGKKFWVEHDWIKRDLSHPACDKLPADGKAEILRDAVCAIFRTGIFSQHLTPDFDDHHRNHIHIDLSSNERFIQ